MEAFGYSIQEEFDIKFDNGTCAKCIALEPPEKHDGNMEIKISRLTKASTLGEPMLDDCLYHQAPEIFVSDGEKGSIVGDWVESRGGVGGIHHLAYQVESVQAIMEKWKSKGYAEFTTDKVLTCPGLTQVFTKPSELTGIIYEFIEREGQGFCQDNVKSLMDSTKGI